MLTPDYLDTVADPVIEIFERLQEEILADIVRRIVKTNYITPTAEWQTMKLQESGMLLKDIKKHIQKTLNLTDEELKELFEQATIENLSGHYTKSDIVKLLKRDTTMYQSILSGLEKTEGHLTNMTQTTASAYQQLFLESLDDAYWKVNSGAFDYNSAIVNATDTMLKKGQTVIEYPSGWRNAVDVAVRRAVLTGINQTQGQVQMDLAEELGLDYVDVSAHLGARPSHAEWQGKRYCISGKDPDFEKFEDATGYGTGEGLCGWNCRHTFFAVTKNANYAYSNAELKALKDKKVTYNGQEIGYYDATQTMRNAERKARGLRRDLVAINELPDSPEKTALFNKKSLKLKTLEGEYNNFCEQTGLLPQKERMRVYEYNKALSNKVGKASKQYAIQKASENTAKAVKYTKQVKVAQQATSVFDLNKQYYNIWKDPVTLVDYDTKKDAIQSKKDYFLKQMANYPTSPNYGTWEKALNSLDEFETQGKAYSESMKKLQSAQKKLTNVNIQMQGKGLTVAQTKAGYDPYSKWAKDNALWYTEDKYGWNVKTIADGYLRDVSGNAWRSSTKAQRNAIYGYTGSYHRFNEPLRGIRYAGSNSATPKEAWDLTQIIEKSWYDKDIWLNRGVRYNGMDNFFKCSLDLLMHGSDEELKRELVGKVCTEGAFLSTSPVKASGFSGDIILNIFAPSGTKMMYVEPFSAFGYGSGKSWDGLEKQYSFGSEFEVLIQQGTMFKISNVYRNNGTLYFDMDIIGQKPLSLEELKAITLW